MHRQAVATARRLWLDRIRRRPIVFTDARGLRYELRPDENGGIYFRHRGNYEVAETLFCERHLRAGDTAIDVGANIGLYSLLFAKLVGPAGRVIAFEPESENHARLMHNLALNGQPAVVAEELAVYRTTGSVILNVFEPALGAWHSIGAPRLPHALRRGEMAAPTSAVKVACVTLDDYCASAGIDRIHLLKIDVEGAEPDVLEGARGLLSAGAVDRVLFEVSLPQLAAAGHDGSTAFTLLHDLGYSTHVVTPEGEPGSPVAVTEQVYGNYIALPRAA
jgi:FkbM family methyltransferase